MAGAMDRIAAKSGSDAAGALDSSPRCEHIDRRKLARRSGRAVEGTRLL